MVKKAGAGILLAAFLLFSSFPPSLYCLPSPDQQKTPVWWELRIQLSSQGEYRLEQKEVAYLGEYSFTVLWTGSMENDDEDYIIYHEDCQLLEWKATEKRTEDSSSRIKATQDFKEKPSFKFNYILRKENCLYFDFFVQKFPILQDEAPGEITITMPSSADVAEPQSRIEYESKITSGSNRVFLKEKDIYVSQVEREFSWTWKSLILLPCENASARLSNVHRVKVSVSAKPHFR